MSVGFERLRQEQAYEKQRMMWRLGHNALRGLILLLWDGKAISKNTTIVALDLADIREFRKR